MFTLLNHFDWIVNWAASWQNQQNDCAPSEDSDQPGHPPSLIRVFVRLMGSQGPKLSSCGQRRLWSDWADAQADLSLCWVHTHFVGFVMSRRNSHVVHSWCLNFVIEMRGWLECELSHDKTNKMIVRPAKTQISLSICPVWSESSLSAWRKLGPLATQWVHSEDSDQAGQMPRLIWMFAGRTATLLVSTWDGSCMFLIIIFTVSKWSQSTLLINF